MMERGQAMDDIEIPDALHDPEGTAALVEHIFQLMLRDAENSPRKSGEAVDAVLQAFAASPPDYCVMVVRDVADKTVSQLLLNDQLSGVFGVQVRDQLWRVIDTAAIQYRIAAAESGG